MTERAMLRHETRAYCPYCGEPITLLLESSDSGAEYVEDCQVCCRPMVVTVDEGADGEPLAAVRRDDE